MILGIDAASIRHGGTVTHLVQLLEAADPARHGFSRVVVWGGGETIGRLPVRPWLEPHSPPALDRGLARRAAWQSFALEGELARAGCDVLLVPGGYHFVRTRPVVAIAQNLLPFAPGEPERYGWGRDRLRLALLRRLYARSFRRSDALIVLSTHARELIAAVAAPRSGRVATIAHGVAPGFLLAPRPPRSLADCSAERPFRILYVSTIDLYKHQWEVAEAVAALGRAGLPVRLDLVGAAFPQGGERLRATLRRVDPEGRWVHYLGPTPHEGIAAVYAAADLYYFGSTCEAFGQVLSEAMAAGLPIVCSDRSSMPEILGGAGLTCDPEDPAAIRAALERAIAAPALRADLAARAYQRACALSWARCADETLALCAEVTRGRPA